MRPLFIYLFLFCIDIAVHSTKIRPNERINVYVYAFYLRLNWHSVAAFSLCLGVRLHLMFRALILVVVFAFFTVGDAQEKKAFFLPGQKRTQTECISAASIMAWTVVHTSHINLSLCSLNCHLTHIKTENNERETVLKTVGNLFQVVAFDTAAHAALTTEVTGIWCRYAVSALCFISSITAPEELKDSKVFLIYYWVCLFVFFCDRISTFFTFKTVQTKRSSF